MKVLSILGAFIFIVLVHCKINLKSIHSVNNIKEYKKILKTNKNVLALYSKDDKSALSLLRWMEDVAKEIKGKGMIVYINCGDSKDAKKLCKKYSVNPKPKALKHYKDGEFHKDYDRKDTAKSLLNFMLDPTGDAPWEEDPAAKNVVQVSSEKELNKLRRKEKGPLLIMFYAPWCGYCKRFKPDFAAAATELKGKAVLAGMDVDKPDAFNVRYQFNITGFPTLIYFKNGKQKFNYGGKMDKEGLISWLQDPKPAEEQKPEDEEEPWSTQAPEILHLTDATFDEGLKEHSSLIVMFYAPWCGHCKAMKPEYVDAAKQMAEEEIPGKLAAVDCTKEKVACKKFDVSGYPTVKYFSNAEYKFKLSMRKKDKIVEFMKNPEEPPQPPPEDLPWPEVSGPEILHLTDATFKDELKKKKHVLVMFYAPWCGHCKKAKPEYEKAAEHYKDDRKVWFAGVDCTVEKKSCEQFDVSGFPTFRYFLYGKKDFKYEGGRNSDAFIKFMEDPKEQTEEPAMEEPQWKDTPSGVVHLGDNDFDDFLKSHTSLLVMFYAPWCGHCKAMKPAYTEAANELLGTNHAIAAVDCTKNRKVASKYNINGYPTLKYFENGEQSEYTSGRDKDSIVSFLIQKTAGEPAKKKLTGWAAESNFVHHLDSDNFDSHLQQYSAVLVMFYAPWCGHCKKMKPAFADASLIVNHEKKVEGSLAAVDCTANTALCQRFDIRGYPTLKFFKNGVKTIDYGGGRESEDFVSFMIDPQPAKPKPVEKDWAEEQSDIVFLTDSTFEEFVTKESSVFVMFYAPWCGHCKKMKPALVEAAKLINNGDEVPGKLAAVDCVKNSAIAAKYEVNGYPTLKYFKDGKELLKYRGPRTVDGIIAFMKRPSAGANAMNTKPQKTWAEESQDIFQLTASNFDEFLKEKDVFVAFYAPWCGHCSDLKPAFFTTAKKLKEENYPTVLAAVDATQAKDIAKREGVNGYPTLKFYSNGVAIAPFEKMRTVPNMIEFIRDTSGKERVTRFDKEKWEDIPSSVQHVTDLSFNDYVSKTDHALVAFHIDCDKCVSMRTNLMQAASRVNSQTSLGIAAVNCEKFKDFCASQGVTSFPAIKYLKHGQFVQDYPSGSKVEEIVNFLQTKVKEEL